jgi:hypothetical protein
MTWDATASCWKPAVQAGGGTWGSILGTLANQVDLNTALGLKSGLHVDWSFLTGIPVSFVPFPHSATHRNGGTDEVASSTPGANLIPKAGAGGTLAIGFIASGTPTGGKFVRDDNTLAVPGTGSIVLTSGAGTPGAPDNLQTSCGAPTSTNLAIYIDTVNQGQWWCSATDTWLKILNVTGSGPFGMIGGTGTVPSTPASGSVSCYFDSTSTTLICINSSGAAYSMVKAEAGASHQFLTAMSAAGIFSKAQPAFTDLSGAAVIAQIPTGSTSSTVPLGNDARFSDARVPTAPYKIRTCEIHIWGSGTSQVLQDTDDELASCYNDYGVTETIAAVRCWGNAGSPTVLPIINGGGTILSGALTCGTASWAAGTLSGTPTLSAAGSIDGVVTTAGGTATNIRIVITLTR